MARIRSIKPELCDSEMMASCSAEVERTFLRLWTHCDDDGRTKDHPKLIKAALFPLHDDVTAQTVDVHLDILAAKGLIRRYEVDGKRYLMVTNWAEHQKPQKKIASKLPPPPSGSRVGLPDESRSPTVAVGEDYGPVVVDVDVVVEGEVEDQNRCSPVSTSLALVGQPVSPAKPVPPKYPSKYPAEFEHWWGIYPRKAGKGAALKAWRRAKAKVGVDALNDSASAYAEALARSGRDPEFIPHPATWLSQSRWDDELPVAAKPVARNPSRADLNRANLQASLARMNGTA